MTQNLADFKAVKFGRWFERAPGIPSSATGIA
jgi:hypothetical protein